MKKIIYICMSLLVVLIVTLAVFFMYDKANKLVLKCSYETNILHKDGLYADIRQDEEVFFINLKNKTINGNDWKPKEGFDVYIDKTHIDFNNEDCFYSIDRGLGAIKMFKLDKHEYINANGTCVKYDYKQKF